MIAADVFLILCVILAFSRFGRIKLAREGDDEPEFTDFAWVAMMFAAYMGIGLIFYGVGEPVAHYLSPPPSTDATAGDFEAAGRPWSTRSSTGR